MLPLQCSCKDGLNIGQILRLTSFAQDDQVGRGSLHKCLLFGKLIEFTPSAVEPRRFRYGDKYDGNVVARLMPEGK